MTYCLALALNTGLVFAADSRTTAGVDQVSNYRKLHTFQWPGERVFALLSAGNLATTQAVVKRLELDAADDEAETSLPGVPHMSAAAEYVGSINAEVQNRQGGMAQQGMSFEATFILGGQIKGGDPELSLIYPEGNHIAVSPDQPFLQIGETKYGKPILDRMISPTTTLEDAARCALVSIDSTMRSNLTVGPPVDLLIYRKDSLVLDREIRFKMNTPYYASLRKQWTEGMRRVFDGLPRFEWEKQRDEG